MPRAPTPKIGISACLLGHKVRYDGDDTRDALFTDILGRYVRWVPVCPELEAGMGVPREPVRLVGSVSNPLMIGERSAKNWTQSMRRVTARKARDLEALGISGYVFKSRSPSCGLERVPVYRGRAGTPRPGRGLFAAGLIRKMPSLPVEEESRLHDPQVCENFIERVFACWRWQKFARRHKSVGALVEFHARHKLLLLAHSETHYRRLGRLVAAAKRLSINKAYERYGRLFMAALAVDATVKKHSNVLEHMAGYFSKHVSPQGRQELSELIRGFRRRLIPLAVPLTVMRRYAKKYRILYLQNQIYLKPYAMEIMRRHHV